MYIIEGTENNKNGPMENKSNTLNQHDNNSDTGGKAVAENNKKGFVAWPDEEKLTSQADVEILEGRTKKGGYVAIPVNKK